LRLRVDADAFPEDAIVIGAAGVGPFGEFAAGAGMPAVGATFGSANLSAPAVGATFGLESLSMPAVGTAFRPATLPGPFTASAFPTLASDGSPGSKE